MNWEIDLDKIIFKVVKSASVDSEVIERRVREFSKKVEEVEEDEEELYFWEKNKRRLETWRIVRQKMRIWRGGEGEEKEEEEEENEWGNFSNMKLKTLSGEDIVEVAEKRHLHFKSQIFNEPEIQVNMGEGEGGFWNEEEEFVKGEGKLEWRMFEDEEEEEENEEGMLV